jgi:hypothetical protein
MGTVGNAQNALATIIAENEEKSPFQPMSVRRGFKKGENILTTLTGWGVLSAANWKVNRWGPDMDYPQIIKDIYVDQSPGLFGTFVILSPPIADFVRDAGYDSIEKLTQWVTESDGAPPAFGAKAPPKAPAGKPGAKAGAKAKPRGGFGMMGGNFDLIVTGASNNNYWMVGGFRPGRSIQIDDWR